MEISMLPLSFKEYCQLQDREDKVKLFAAYLQNGSFPYVATLNQLKEEEVIPLILEKSGRQKWILLQEKVTGYRIFRLPLR